MKKHIFAALLVILSLMASAALADVQSVSVTNGQCQVVTTQDVMDVSIGDPSQGRASSVVGVENRADGTRVWTIAATNGSVTGSVYYTSDGTNWHNAAMMITLSGGQSAPNVTAAPVVNAATPVPQTAPWPAKTFKAYTATMIPSGDERVQSRGGPSREYAGVGAYKTYKMYYTDALFYEGSYVFVDMSYQSIGYRRLYFPKNVFQSIDRNVPTEDLTAYPAYTNQTVTPIYGPDVAYDSFEEATLSPNTTISVFFQENDYVFAQFTYNNQPVRCYLPADSVTAK